MTIKKLFSSLIIILALWLLFPSYSQASDISYRLRGSFLLSVEEEGKVYYVDTDNGLRHELTNFNLAKLEQLALGIKTSDLAKIPVAVDARFLRYDSDGDGLDDRLERALALNPTLSDTDNDSYSDAVELKYHFNPLGAGRSSIDLDFSASLRGMILMQVEAEGQLWYVNVEDNLRYYLGDSEDLRRLILYLAKGITKNNLDEIVDARVIKDDNKKSIRVDVGPSQRVYYYLDGVELGSFPVSSGSYEMPTPQGSFEIINKHPKAWSSYGLWMPYWLGLGTGRFGFHELPIWPSGYREGEDHLGRAVSHGCIRLGVGPAQFLYNWAEIGTPVEIY
jgi:hypothetical protein